MRKTCHRGGGMSLLLYEEPLEEYHTLAYGEAVYPRNIKEDVGGTYKISQYPCSKISLFKSLAVKNTEIQVDTHQPTGHAHHIPV